MDCPECACQMEVDTIETVTIDYCSGCSLIWFDKDELSNHLKTRVRDPTAVPTDLAFHPSASESGSVCPRCSHRPLDIGNYQGFSFHRCPICSGYLFNLRTIAEVARRLSNVVVQDEELSWSSPRNFFMGVDFLDVLGDIFGGALDF